MDIYYKRIETWCKWPDNDVIDEKYVLYSTSKKKFTSKSFLRTDVSVETKDRILKVSEVLGVNPKKVNLIKLN